MRTRLSLSSDARDGLRDIAPVMIAAAPIGGLFGAVAASKGLSLAEVALMSALVFAGGAQFAAIELWSYPVPVAAIAVLDAPDQRPPRADGRLARAEDARLLVGAALSRLLLPHRRGLGARRAPRARPHGDAGLLVRLCRGAAGLLDRIVDRSAPRSARSLAIRSASAPTSPSRRCSSGSSPASARAASRRRRSPRAAAPRRSLIRHARPALACACRAPSPASLAAYCGGAPGGPHERRSDDALRHPRPWRR